MTRPIHLLSWSLQLKDANTGESKDFQVYLKIYLTNEDVALS